MSNQYLMPPSFTVKSIEWSVCDLWCKKGSNKTREKVTPVCFFRWDTLIENGLDQSYKKFREEFLWFRMLFRFGCTQSNVRVCWIIKPLSSVQKQTKNAYMCERGRKWSKNTIMWLLLPLFKMAFLKFSKLNMGIRYCSKNLFIYLFVLYTLVIFIYCSYDVSVLVYTWNYNKLQKAPVSSQNTSTTLINFTKNRSAERRGGEGGCCTVKARWQTKTWWNERTQNSHLWAN